MPLKQMSFRLKPSYFERDVPVCTRSASSFCRNPLNFCTHAKGNCCCTASHLPLGVTNEERDANLSCITHAQQWSHARAGASSGGATMEQREEEVRSKKTRRRMREGEPEALPCG